MIRIEKFLLEVKEKSTKPLEIVVFLYKEKDTGQLFIDILVLSMKNYISMNYTQTKDLCVSRT